MTHGEWFFLTTIIFMSLARTKCTPVVFIGRILLVGTAMFNAALFFIDIIRG